MVVVVGLLLIHRLLFLVLDSLEPRAAVEESADEIVVTATALFGVWDRGADFFDLLLASLECGHLVSRVERAPTEKPWDWGAYLVIEIL